MNSEADSWWLHGGGEPNTGPECMVLLNPILLDNGDLSKPILPEICQVTRSLACFPVWVRPCVCSSTMAHWWALAVPLTQQHSFMVRFVSISDYTLLPPFFFSRLCLFPLIFLVNRSLLPPSCLYQLIYNITCLPALFSVGPVPSGIRISTSKVVWSVFFFFKWIICCSFLSAFVSKGLLSAASGLVFWPLFSEHCYPVDVSALTFVQFLAIPTTSHSSFIEIPLGWCF